MLNRFSEGQRLKIPVYSLAGDGKIMKANCLGEGA